MAEGLKDSSIVARSVATIAMCKGLSSSAADPKIGFAIDAEPSGGLSSLLSGQLHNQSVADGRQRPFYRALVRASSDTENPT